MEEIWINVIGFENLYEVSNFGNVRNKITGHILIGDLNSAGYRRITLYDNKYSKRYLLHRLVPFHFCPGYREDLVVNHLDGNKMNNCAYNLEWCTRSENDLHAFRLNLRKYVPTDKIRKPEYYIITTNVETNEINICRSKEEFSNYYNKSKSSIQEMTSKGYFYDNKTKMYIERINPNTLIKPLIFY